MEEILTIETLIGLIIGIVVMGILMYIDYKKEEMTVTSETIIPVSFAPNGGWVAIIERL